MGVASDIRKFLMIVNGQLTYIRNRDKMQKRGGFLVVNYLGRELNFVYKYSLGFEPYPLSEIFLQGTYKKLNVRGRTVIDIGSSIADSPIYFSLNGARQVYGFDIDDERYVASIENIKINKVGNVKLFHRKFDPAIDAKLLQDCVIKIDCEGCEYELIKKLNLSKVREIILEFHNGEKELPRILHSNRFETTILEKKGDLGILYAVKKD